MIAKYFYLVCVLVVLFHRLYRCYPDILQKFQPNLHNVLLKISQSCIQFSKNRPKYFTVVESYTKLTGMSQTLLLHQFRLLLSFEQLCVFWQFRPFIPVAILFIGSTHSHPLCSNYMKGKKILLESKALAPNQFDTIWKGIIRTVEFRNLSWFYAAVLILDINVHIKSAHRLKHGK